MDHSVCSRLLVTHTALPNNTLLPSDPDPAQGPAAQAAAGGRGCEERAGAGQVPRGLGQVPGEGEEEGGGGQGAGER